MKTGLYYILLIACCWGMSCSNRTEKAENRINASLPAGMPAPSDTLRYEGTYSGTFPCVDCEGIRTELTLQGNAFTMRRTYLGQENSQTIENTGTFVWDNPQTVILDVIDMPTKYVVGGNSLTAIVLDETGNPVTGELAGRYILRKNL